MRAISIITIHPKDLSTYWIRRDLSPQVFKSLNSKYSTKLIRQYVWPRPRTYRSMAKENPPAITTYYQFKYKCLHAFGTLICDWVVGCDVELWTSVSISSVGDTGNSVFLALPDSLLSSLMKHWNPNITPTQDFHAHQFLNYIKIILKVHCLPSHSVKKLKIYRIIWNLSYALTTSPACIWNRSWACST